MSNRPLSREKDIVVQELEKEILIYDLKANKAFCLNETARQVFDLCDGTKTISEISDSLSKKLHTKVDDEFIFLTINDLQKNGLMKNSGISELLTTKTRRELLKKAGLASIIALPLISSIVAPSSANAASGGPLLTLCVGCSSPAQCASGTCVSSRCSPVGSVAGILGPIGGACPGNSVVCLSSACSTGCCSGSTSFSPGSCVCNPAP